MSAPKSLESSPPTPCPIQIATLERRIAELEQDKVHLAEAVSESSQRVAEAVKSTAAAEAETAAAKQRAQTRYTERLHANNEARNLQDAMKEQAFQHKDFSIKANRRISCLEVRIAHLETEVSIKDAKIQELEEELRKIHTGSLANQREDVNMKTQPDKIVEDLKNKIIGLEVSLAKAEQDKEQAMKDKDAMANSQAKFETEQAHFKSREMALMQTNQIKLQDAELNWRSRLDIIAKELKEAKREAEDAKHKLRVATRTMQNTPQTPGVQQQQQQLQTSKFDKKRRFSPNGNAEATAAAFQRACNQSLLLNCFGMGSNLLAGPSGGTPRTEAPPVPRQPMSMAQNTGYQQYPSVSFDSSACQSPPIPIAQQQYFPGHGPSPVQQHGMQMQPGCPMGQQQPIGPLSSQQQQPGLVQNARLNNAGSPTETHSNHGINVNLAVNTGNVQQPHHSMVQQPPPSFMPSHMHQSNSTNASFFPNAQGNITPSTYGNDFFAAESSNVAPSNIDYFHK
ncbi:hypothetical protein COCCADRAFT_25235 [Bipolaris zeicola 26-R-13]|uniref:Uncharacterized protein n=1 Tax=Cochliobolus carbonum (strain 26-R-13) TaxID=930089 RepID=W6YB12_COCC2|nr:uncharacterized protein COCCADRAFT_25235 [Bipolaris zeicola 26-R-13]EUC34675.1 hypothetical protein COCCADRAFT_25235 [Bipolaris zeicola 26-R-13]